MASYKNRIINDAVFGSIELIPICARIIDTPEFQRLRYIKQLSCVPYVYPSAAHSRFEHSIGVYHVAKEMMAKLEKKQRGEPTLCPKIVPKDTKCVTIAALCHDLGHGPFSHSWEEFMKKANPRRKWKHEEHSEKIFDVIWGKIWDEFKKSGSKEHPDMSLRSDANNQDSKLTKKDNEFIKSLIRGKLPKDLEGDQKSFLFEVVANKRNGVDVDKFAYLTQDSFFLGINTSFDYKRLIEMARVVRVDDENERPHHEICYKSSEELNVYYTFLTRWNLHRRAYRHPVVRRIDAMLIDALVAANVHLGRGQDNGKKESLSEAVDDIDWFVTIEDSIFNQMLNLPDDSEAHKLTRRIENRQLYKQVGERLIPKPSKKMVDAFFKEGSALSRTVLASLNMVDAFFEEETDLSRSVMASLNSKWEEMKDDKKRYYYLKAKIGEHVKSEFQKIEHPMLESEYHLDIVCFDLGKEDKDPMNEIKFYKEDKANKMKPVLLTQSEKQSVSSLLTENFEEVLVELIWKPIGEVPGYAEKAFDEGVDEWLAEMELYQENAASSST